jgi:hypothetical protein
VPDVRDVGAITQADLDAENISFNDFVRIEFPSPTGTKRFTNRPGGYVGNIDGASQTWDEYDVVVGRLAQGADSILDVSWVDFADVDNVFSGYAELHNGLTYISATIFRAHFAIPDDPPDSPGALLDSYIVYDGRLDEAQVGTRIRISLVPHRTSMGKPLPARLFLPGCQNEYGDEMCQRTPDGTFPTCPKTRDACIARGNIVHFVGFDLIPKQNAVLKWGNAAATLPNAPVWVNVGGIMMLVTGGSDTYSLLK